jgi:rhodanese-related sulfurtransferase
MSAVSMRRRSERPRCPSARAAGNDVGVSDEAEVEQDIPQPFAVALDEAVRLIEAGATVIDVRRDYEFQAGHLEGARNLEMNELTAHAEEIPRDLPVVFYCRSGNRSSMAADAFQQAGYDAHNLRGGIAAWRDAGRGLEPPDGDVAVPLPPS